MFSGRGQPSCEQLIDRYRIACRPVRDVLVDYLRERQPAVDFSSLQRLAYLLGKLFWADLEAHHPGIDSLQAAPRRRRGVEAARDHPTRRHQAATARSTGPRLDGRSVLTAVRAFYLDLAEWAEDDPARWGPWAVRCPVSASDASHKKDRCTAQVPHGPPAPANGSRCCPTLVAWVAAERARTAELLAAAEHTRPGELFTAAGETLRRAVLKTQTTGRVWAEEPDSGRRRDLSFEEHRGVLDLGRWSRCSATPASASRNSPNCRTTASSNTGCRRPESSSRCCRSPRRRPTRSGCWSSHPSSPTCWRRSSAASAATADVPLVVSYDKNERVYNPPMPLLFQWRRRLEDQPVSRDGAARIPRPRARRDRGQRRRRPPLRYTFHDFRRMFITDAILHGMPPHIAQLVAGHRDINTTMGYKAVYPEEVINGHRAFITRRRALRPSEEYRMPTDEEWAEFLGHFARRKVALGECGRSYDTAMHPRAQLLL